MNVRTSESDLAWDLRNPPDFSLVLGGPLYQLLLKAHLSDDALMMVRQRVIIIALIAWVPLLVLSALEGHLWRGDSGVSFLHDIEVHIRFLVAMPLLIVAELIVHNRLRPLLHQFGERDLIPAAEIPRFESAVASAFHLRNSVLAEVLLIAFVYAIGVVVVWRHYIALDTATWYATPSPAGTELTPAGWWYGYVSLPMFQFLLCRWYFRLFIWSRFLWQVSRIPLRLNPVHPDRLGALGFLSNTVYAFAVIAVAHGVLLAGTLANRIFFADAALMQFKAQVAVVVVLLLCIVLGPLLMFSPQLARAKRVGLREYGALSQRYAREFDAKWLRGGAPAGEPFLGSADIQSLADLANSFEVVRTMRFVPVTRDAVFGLVVATLAPLAPLMLTMMPLEELLKTLFSVLA